MKRRKDPIEERGRLGGGAIPWTLWVEITNQKAAGREEGGLDNSGYPGEKKRKKA